ncbi:MAG: hypothetical protein OXH20_10640 [bacterium]|nr:hypothetical protein [bacterium]MDE0669495.1 hypothetical protein [bacterium]
MSSLTGGQQAHIFEGGFRPYEGPRLAPQRSFASLYSYSLGRLLGRKRRFRSKLIGIAAFFVAWIGAIVQIFLAGLFAEFGDLGFDTVREYYTQVGVGMVLFTVVATPMLLNSDRRSGLLSLYLASPLSRRSYVHAQTSAVFSLLIAMSLVPVLALGIVYTSLGWGPGGAGDFFVFLLRTVAAALALAAVPTALAVAVCSLVRRTGMAIVVIALCLLVPAGVTTLLIEQAGVASEIAALDPLRMSRALAKRSHALALDDFSAGTIDAVATWAVVLVNLAWAALLSLVAHWRYGRMEVER